MKSEFKWELNAGRFILYTDTHTHTINKLAYNMAMFMIVL